MNLTLRCTHSRSADQPETARSETRKITARTSLEGDALAVEFTVEMPRAHGRPELQKEHSHWALWDEGDVVELFLNLGDITQRGYFEFQVSPWNQFFTLHILEPRKRTDDQRPMPFEHESFWDASAGLWTARMKIPLREYEWDGSAASIQGGLFAILGAAGARDYWSAFLPQQEKPDYHLPAWFRPLL